MQFDRIIQAMVAAYGVNPEYGCVRPGIIRHCGSRVTSHDWEFLVNGVIHRYSDAQVDAAVGALFPATPAAEAAAIIDQSLSVAGETIERGTALMADESVFATKPKRGKK